MIEINLVPDVKQELLRAQRQRTLVVSVSIMVSVVAIGLVALLGGYVLVQQALVGRSLDNSISQLTDEIEAKDGLPNALTVQRQLGAIAELYESRTDSSRMFDVLSAISPKSNSKNALNISNLVLDEEEHRITIEAQATNGYEALETFKKTILSTRIVYLNEGEEVQEPLAEMVIDGDRSYGEDSDGRKVLRFTISFDYPEDLFATTITGMKIVAPRGEVNVTDSKINVPSSLFSERVEREDN